MEIQRASWVVAYSDNQAFNANIIAKRLNAEGIQTRIDNENIISSNPLLANAVGGVRVLVLEHNLTSAKRVIQQHNSETLLEALEDTAHIQDRCTNCGSTLISRLPSPTWIWLPLTIITLGATLWLRKNKWYCFDCNTPFTKDFQNS